MEQCERCCGSRLNMPTISASPHPGQWRDTTEETPNRMVDALPQGSTVIAAIHFMFHTSENQMRRLMRALVHSGGTTPRGAQVILSRATHLFPHLTLRSFAALRMTNPRSLAATRD